MGNPFYRPGDQRAAGVHDLFGAIANRYDLLNDVQSFGLHRAWKRRLVALAAARPGQRVLDLCCGTGDVALRFARCGATVVGLDFSEPMLAVARQRASRAAAAAGRVVFVQGDALHLPFAADTFDAVTVSYGLRNLADLKGGLQEMWRVAKPGGRMLALDFGKPSQPMWRELYFGYLRCVVPLLGRGFAGSGAAYAYILESLLHYPGQRGVASLFAELPTRDVRIVEFLGGVMAINRAEKTRA